MKLSSQAFLFASKTIAVLAIITQASAVFAHVTLEDQAALAGRSYKAVFKVGHACEGSPTTAIQVTIPAGFTGAKPMPKAGWKLDIKTAKLAVPYDNHGTLVTDDVSEITCGAVGDHPIRHGWTSTLNTIQKYL